MVSRTEEKLKVVRVFSDVKKKGSCIEFVYAAEKNMLLVKTNVLFIGYVTVHLMLSKQEHWR